MTVKEYYKHFASIFGVMTATVSSLPLIAEFFPNDYANYLFPPLGPSEAFFRVAALVLVALTTLIAYFAKDKPFVSSKRGRVNVLVCVFTAALVGVGLYMVLNWKCVRSIPIPSNAGQIVVSVGYERTTYAHKQLGDATDWDLLRQRGPTEEEIWKLWTSGSIVLCRGGLFLSYLLFLLSAATVGSLAVMFDKSGLPPNP